jgi:hypothetical protein
MTYPWVRMAPLPEQRDGLRDDMVGGEEEVLQTLTAEAFEDVLHPAMIVVPFHEQREQEAGVEEDQSCGSP